MSNTFCPIPWIFQAVRANGDVRVCCQANVTPNKGVLRKQDGSAYNAGFDSLDDSRNSKLMRAMRINMLNNQWSQECGRCLTEESNGLHSRRTEELKQWDYTLEQAKADTDQDGNINTELVPVRHYDIRFGNFCNLKCRMCGPTDSSAWYEDWIKLTGSNTFKDSSGNITIENTSKGLHAKEFDWPNYEPFWQQLEKNANTIEHVYFAGGEPMLIERHYDFLEYCVQNDYAKNISVEYNTNMSTLPSRVKKLWEWFKSVKIGASIDGMDKVFEYQRHPAKWLKTLKNLQTLDNMAGNVRSWLAFTVTAYTVDHMIDFMKWKLTESGFKKINSTRGKPIITHHVAHHPKHLNIRVLPNEEKARLTERFNNFLTWIEENKFEKHVVEHAHRIANGVCKYMNSESYYNDHWQEFCSYTKKLDTMRNESIAEVCPNLEKYMI